MSPVAAITPTTDDIRQELSRLDSRIRTLEARLGQNGAGVDAPFELASVMDKVLEITHELFPGTCQFTSEFDPESPEDRYVIVHVEATGDLKEIAERGCIWDERILRLSENLFRILRLSIVPR
jgi:hypothetical protein